MTITKLLVVHATTGHESPIGEVQIDAAGMLTLLSAIPEQADYLNGWVKRLNERKDFTLKGAPPAGTAAPMLSSHGHKFSRSEPSFTDKLKIYVSQLHGIKLMSQADIARQCGDSNTKAL